MPSPSREGDLHVLQDVHQAIIACSRCARLRAWCQRVATEKKAAHRHETYWGKPVTGFGDPKARVVILGLAPAAHGANRTGRMFTGDGSGDFLMRAMFETGFANLPTSQHVHDGLQLTDAYMLSAVRCAPPANTPSRDEIAACASHLHDELAALPNMQVVVALGRIGTDAFWRWIEWKGVRVTPRPRFAHGRLVAAPAADLPALIQSYHPSRQNTNTGRLTPDMLRTAFELARRVTRRSDSLAAT